MKIDQSTHNKHETWRTFMDYGHCMSRTLEHVDRLSLSEIFIGITVICIGLLCLFIPEDILLICTALLIIVHMFSLRHVTHGK